MKDKEKKSALMPNDDAKYEIAGSKGETKLPIAELRQDVYENMSSGYSSSTKRRFVVDESNWWSGREELPENPERYDLFRILAGKYWTTDERATAQAQLGHGSAPLLYFYKGKAPNKTDGIPFKIYVYPPSYHPVSKDDDNIFFEVKHPIRLTADKAQFQDVDKKVYMPDRWKALINGNHGDYSGIGVAGIIKQFVEYEYCAFSVPLPSTDEELNNLALSGQMRASVKPEYNFYIQQYEDALNGLGRIVNERALPNLYAIMMERLNEKSNPHLYEHISLGNTLSESTTKALGAISKVKFDIKKHSKQYFATFARGLPSALDTLESWSNRFKNMVFTAENISLLKEITSKKEMFPMFVDIEIATDKTAEFTDLLRGTHLLDRFTMETAKAVSRKELSQDGSIPETSFVEVTESQTVIENDDDTKHIARFTSTEERTSRVWNITDWIEKIALVNLNTGNYSPTGETSEDDIEALEQIVAIDDGTAAEMQTLEPQNKFFHSLMGIIFMSKLKELMKKRMKNWNHIIKGKPCYSETVLYRIEKRRADEFGNPTGEVIQNFWLPNLSDQDVVKIVDTQIKYGQHYTYSIYAYQLVIKTLYKHGKPYVTNNTAEIITSMRPQPVLVEQKIFEESHLIMDAPPIPPDMQIIPYFAKDRKLLINLNGSVDDYIAQPIEIEFEDNAAIQEIRTAQKIAEPHPIRFNSDDSIGDGGSFEIFRIGFHPKSWADFDGGRIARPAINAFGGFSIKASSASYVDTLKPNTKYYYMARVVDAHFHVSNPTAIYEVELVNDQGSIYLSKRIVDFLPVEPKAPSKPMRRLIEIKPAVGQSFATLDESLPSASDVKDISLGDEVGVWGKQYKFRFVSKKTGKKIDLNVICKSKVETRVLKEE